MNFVNNFPSLKHECTLLNDHHQSTYDMIIDVVNRILVFSTYYVFVLRRVIFVWTTEMVSMCIIKHCMSFEGNIQIFLFSLF